MPLWLAVMIIGVLVGAAVVVWVPVLRFLRRADVSPPVGVAERQED
jgi:hypothetical protein